LRTGIFSIALRSLAVLALVAGIVLVVIYRDAINPLAIRNSVAANPFAPLLFVALQILASLLFVPRTVLGLAAGLLFGLFWGLLWAMLGAIAGAAAGFAFVRWIGIQSAFEMSPRLERLIARTGNGGWRAVAVVRLTPLPHSVANTALALSKVSWRDYLIGSLIGMFPMTFAQVEIGASGGLAFRGHTGWMIACLLLATGLGLSFFLSRLNRQK
jgi:uncharacterized membrane protein YdjX (TVP38/TMEM64 family)